MLTQKVVFYEFIQVIWATSIVESVLVNGNNTIIISIIIFGQGIRM